MSRSMEAPAARKAQEGGDGDGGLAGFVDAHPSGKDKGVARVGYPGGCGSAHSLVRWKGLFSPFVRHSRG